MGNVTEEKSLMKIDNGLFSKVRKLWFKIWGKRKYNKQFAQEEEFDIYQEEETEEYQPKQRKLFDFDAEDDNTANVQEGTVTTGEENEAIEYMNNTQDNEENNHNDELYKNVEVDGDGEDINTTFLFEKKKLTASEEREELERKLMNYYESIKPGI